MLISKDYIFDASHFIPGHSKCGVMHGHTWKLSISLSGVVDPDTHMVMDFHLLNDIVRTHIVDIFDHKCINYEVPSDFYPTAETLVEYFSYSLHEFFLPFKNIDGFYIKLQEGEGGWAETFTDLIDLREEEALKNGEN